MRIGTGASNGDPTSFLTAYSSIAGEISRDSLPTPPMDDEFGPTAPSQAPNTDILAAYVAISYVLRASVNAPALKAAYWFFWDSQGGLTLQGTIGGTAYDAVATWLIGSTVNLYTKVGTIYSITGTTGGGNAFKIMFDTGQNCNSGCTTANQSAVGYATWTDILGTSHNVINAVAPVGYKPIFLLQSASAVPPTTVYGSTSIIGNSVIY